MSTLVNVSPTAASSLVSILSPLVSSPQFSSACEKALASDDLSALVTALTEQHVVDTAIAKLETPDDIEGCLTVVISLSPLALAPRIATAISNSRSLPPQSALSALVCLYNSISEPMTKYEAIMSAVAYAGKTNQLASIASVFESADDIAKALNLGVKERRGLYRGMSAVFAETSDRRQSFLLKWLRTFDEAGDDMSDDEVAVAALTIRSAVADPISLFESREDLLGRRGVQQLSGHPTAGPLVDLLSVFVEGKLGDFMTFAEKNKSVLEKEGLKSEDCIGNMRLLSLCSLATEHEEIPFTAIATTLQVEESEVEQWVVRAFTSGLMSGRIDQMNSVVLIERCVHRKFGKEQWEQLKVKLGAWKGNVETVLGNYRRTKAASGVA